MRVKPYHKNIEKKYCFFSHKLSLSILRKLLINMRRYLIYSLIFKNRTFESTSREFIWYFILSNRSRSRNRNGNLLNQYIFWINSSWVHLVDISEKKLSQRKSAIYAGLHGKKYVPISSIQSCLGICYLFFYDIFVMIVIHRTINNNKTGRVFVFFQRGHAIFQLVVGCFIIIFFFLHSLLLLVFTLILEFDRKYQLNLNAGYMQSQFLYLFY